MKYRMEVEVSGAPSRRQLSIDAAVIACRMTTASLGASLNVAASTGRAVRGGARAQRAVAGSWRDAMRALGREYVRQMRKA